MLEKELGVAIASGEAAIRVNTDEIADTLGSITKVCQERGWELRVWDHISGLVAYHGQAPAKAKSNNPLDSMAAPTALNVLLDLLGEEPRPDTAKSAENGDVVLTVTVFVNFHLAFDANRGNVSSAVQHIVRDKVGDMPNYQSRKASLTAAGIGPDSDTGRFIIGLTPPDAKLPPEVDPLFRVINHGLPDQDELHSIASGIVPCVGDGALMSKEDLHKACKYALGLTRLQAEGLFAACTIQFGDRKDFAEVVPKYVWEEKSKILNREGLVTLYQGKETFDDVVGQKGLKDLLKDLLAPDEYDDEDSEMRAKGVALCGPPRTGKSLTAKAVGNSLGLPVLMVELGSWFGGYVGDTERNTRKGFQIIRAHAPCIAVIDEVEKVMPSGRGDSGDSGVSKRMAGTFMSQLQDIKEKVFWVFTANSIEDMHEALLADDRVDAVVYVHMPGAQQRAAGWRMFLKKFFPAELKGKPFPKYVETKFSAVLEAFTASKKAKADVDLWANRFVAALMCVTAGERREELLQQLRKENDAVHAAVLAAMIDDSSWTHARIKSCCRLARKRKRPLTEAAKSLPKSTRAVDKAISRLEKWADGEAIDAETGEIYVREDAKEEAPRVKASNMQARRKVRHLSD